MAKKGAGKGKAVGLGGGAAGGGGGGASDGAKSKNQTILLLATGGADPKFVDFAALAKNKVRWENKASRGLTVTFTYWPFVEAPTPIAVEAGRKSKWYTTVEDLAEGTYTYTITPDLTAGDTPPDPPGLSFDS